ncbi:MAG: hexose kinase [Peptostreptococcus sp.]|uniref:hexose kinase n=1 Tax=Peptostreptococcus sp. TaxID=1262 RepID=UPI002FC9C538
MILTITPNPSVDISYKIDHLLIDDVNRCSNVRKTAGGKGLNVSRVLKQLGANVEATGFIGGVLGDFIIGELDALGIENSFIHTDSNTRNCIAILHDGNNQTEILEQSEAIDSKYETIFERDIVNIMGDKTIITCSGSLPVGISENFYTDIINISKTMNKKIIVDTSGKQLEKVLLNDVKPFAIKPNTDEVRDLLIKNDTGFNKNTKIDVNNISSILRNKLFDGIELILVSAGGNGGYFKYKEDVFKIDIPKVEAVNPVGSGDSTVAGLAYGLSKASSVEESVKVAMTCGILNAMQEKTGYIDTNGFDKIYSKVCVKKL